MVGESQSHILKIDVKTGKILNNKAIVVGEDYTLNTIYSLEFSPNGMKIAARAELTKLFIIDAKTLEIEHVHKYNEPHGYDTSNLVFSFSPDSMYIAYSCLLYTSPSPRDGLLSRMPSSA